MNVVHYGCNSVDDKNCVLDDKNMEYTFIL